MNGTTASVHKLLIHEEHIIKHYAFVPISQLSEEVRRQQIKISRSIENITQENVQETQITKI
jgi:hypothetical protein